MNTHGYRVCSLHSVAQNNNKINANAWRPQRLAATHTFADDIKSIDTIFVLLVAAVYRARLFVLIHAFCPNEFSAFLPWAMCVCAWVRESLWFAVVLLLLLFDGILNSLCVPCDLCGTTTSGDLTKERRIIAKRNNNKFDCHFERPDAA